MKSYTSLQRITSLEQSLEQMERRIQELAEECHQARQSAGFWEDIADKRQVTISRLERQLKRQEAMSYQHIQSSYGSFTCDAQGIVQSCDIGTGLLEDEESRQHLTMITRFDLAEWKQFWQQKELPGSFDILDLGYWYTDPNTQQERYTPAEADYRKSIQQDM